MTIADLVSGGPWALALAIAVAVSTGKLRLGREVEELKDQLDKLTKGYETATAKLDDTQAKERATLTESVAAAERRTAELGARLDRVLEQMAGPTTGRST